MRPQAARARRLTAALCCGALLITAGCGGDDENASETDTTPRTTVPRDNTAPPVTTETTPPQTQTTPPPQTQTTPPPKTVPDSPENDQKPAPGTPESKFEEFCEENPGACG